MIWILGLMILAAAMGSGVALFAVTIIDMFEDGDDG